MPHVHDDRPIVARGPNFVFAKEFILEKYGGDTWERILNTLNGTAAQVWRRSLLVTDTYPFSTFKEMLSALTRVVGAVPDRETARMYEFIADRSLSTVYKLFFRLTDPSFVISRYPMLWKRFFEAGRVEVLEAERGHAVLHFHLPEIFLDWLPPACLGYSTKAVEMAGGRDLKMTKLEQVKEPDGNWRIAFELRWKD